MRLIIIAAFVFTATLVGAAVQVRTHITTGGTLPANCTVGDVWYKTGASAGFYACSATNTWTGVSSGSTALSAITAATGSNAIASGNNSGQVWNWTLTTDATVALTIGETAASSNGTLGMQALLGLNTLSTSTAVPLLINNFGAESSLRINDVSGDTTPFIIDAAGEVCILCSSPPGNYALFINKNGDALGISDGTSIVEIYNSATIASIGTNTNHPFWLEANGLDRVKVYPSGVTEFFRNGNPPTSIGTGATGLTNEYIHVGGNEATTNGYFLIGFGYSSFATVPPAFIGYQEILDSGNTYGDLVFGTRSVTTDTAPTERMRIDNQGTVVLPSTSPAPAVSNTSANSCGTTAATIAGNNNVGTVTVGATSGTDCTLTFTTTAPVEWICQANNQTTTANLVSAIPASTTTARLVGTFGAADKLNYLCIAR